MEQALVMARRAEAEDEVPVGAVIVRDGVLVGSGWNRNIGAHDPTAHAEVIALRAAAATLGNYRLPGCTLYVTLEPCAMCAGAIVHARLAQLVFGATDSRAGAVESHHNLLDDRHSNHRLPAVGGVLAEESSTLLRAFFAQRRAAARN
ncbi:MAG: tRNA adenosine(34) deaminase TadA [Gammaproteobacteria bacterium]|nr:tRNA adenosine(34) deaminase TadA [Gammaproteobacteria bacterium]